jgi:hypothetical protein
MVNVDEIENIMVDSLIDPIKRTTLPIAWHKFEFDLSSTSHARELLRHLAYWLYMDNIKRKEGVN